HRLGELHAGHALLAPGQRDDAQFPGAGTHPMIVGVQTMSLFRTGHRAFAGLRALARDRHGGPVIEFAMAAPALFLFLFGIIELGYAMWIQNALDYSVATASRCASLNGSSCSGHVPSYA